MTERQHCLVTAGAGGAGLVIAQAFAAAGAAVTVCDIDEAAVVALPASLAGIVADASTEAGVDAVFDFAEARHGPVGVLVNNVGIGGPTAGIEDVTLADWERTLAANLTGHFLCIRRAVPAMKAAGGGAIINISSCSARTGLPLRAPYVVSKAGVTSLSLTLARELGPHNIRVNAIAPGPLRGERVERVIRAKAAALGVSRDDYAATLLRHVALGVLTEPEDVAALCVHLASPAGARISGQTIGVDAGLAFEE